MDPKKDKAVLLEWKDKGNDLYRSGKSGEAIGAYQRGIEAVEAYRKAWGELPYKSAFSAGDVKLREGQMYQ